MPPLSWLSPLIIACTLAAPASPPTLRLVDEGQPRAVIVVPDRAAPQLHAAAELLAHYVQRAAGATLPIVAESKQPRPTGVPIYLGSCTAGVKLITDLKKLDADGFVIRVVQPAAIAIAGPSDWGTEFGVDEFLERYLGVRWLLPGPHGDDVPACHTLDVPVGEVRQQPAFFSRLFSGLRGSAQADWARRNRMHGRVEFHHNLNRLFVPSRYVKTHPEFFPIRKGQRFFPPNDQAHGWQPCLSAPGLVDEAIRNICDYFAQHPEAPSYSLGAIDSSGYCECPQCRAHEPAEKNFLGLRNMSDLYYAWCNRVVEGVLKKYPDKYFGCLAYSEVAQAPIKVKVHPRLIPYLTYDRMKWIEPALQAEGQAVTRRWLAVSPVLGWYDYIYGSPYCLPRVWFHKMADYYRFGLANGVRALYAEAYPNWGEGPKLYVSLKLQWDPQQNVDQLLREWYARAVGPAAADDLAAYYAHWEDFWTRRILHSRWFSKTGQYLSFYNPAYLADVNEVEIADCRRRLEQVARKAQTSAQQARAKLLLRAFEYYEASAVAYGGARRAVPPPRTEAEALETLTRGERYVQLAQRRERLVFEEFSHDPVLVHPIEPARWQAIDVNGAAGNYLWRVVDWVARSPALRQRLAAMAAAQGPPAVHARAILTLADGKVKPVSQCPSFEDPHGGWPAAWSRWVRDVGTIQANAQAAAEGRQGVTCRGVRRGGPHQQVAVTPGRYAAMVQMRVPKPYRGPVTVTLAMTPLDAKGQNLADLSTSVPAAPCAWTRLVIADQLPAEIRQQPVARVRLIVFVDGLEPDEEIQFDNLALYRLE
jgi:hypothetical protein